MIKKTSICFSLLFVSSISLKAMASLPLPVYPECGNDGTVDSCPPDLKDDNGNFIPDYWSYLHFIPQDWKTNVRPSEFATGSSTTKAWQVTTGRFDTKIAVLDCGIQWKEGSVRNKVSLNQDELPPPLNASGIECANYDCDNNGIFNIRDYVNDYRVVESIGQNQTDGMIEASDLIYTFSDGIDDDNDGYVDNIAGWDFLWDDNDPYTDNDFYHMTYIMTESSAEGGQANSFIGHCPNCSVMPVRISDSFIGEGNKIAEGIVYAVDHGANIIAMALGSLTNPSFLQSAMTYAWDHNVTIIAAAGDELGYHHNVPGANDYAIYVHSIRHYPITDPTTASSFYGFYGCNNFGSRLDVVTSSTGCASGSVAATSGIAGLMYSRAKDLGIELTSSEARQLLLTGVDDINVKESHLPGSSYFPSSKDWDYFFGYGRTNAGKIVDAITQNKIPAEIEFMKPNWFEYIDPRISPSIDISARISASRAESYSYEISWAVGSDPKPQSFYTLKKASNQTGVKEGILATLDISKIDPKVLNPSSEMEELDGNDSIIEKTQKINSKAIVFKIRVKDNKGVVSEERKQVFLVEDPDLLDGFPYKLGHSGDSQPIVADINGDGKKEIIVATSNGLLNVITNTASQLDGFPVKVGIIPSLDPETENNHLKANAYNEGLVSSDIRQGIFATPAVGDLDLDGDVEIVVSTFDGYVYVFSSNGHILDGFPVKRQDFSDDNLPDETHWFDPGIISSPVLYDIDNNGTLEIIQAAMDQKVYVWNHNAELLNGFPVLIENPDGTSGVSTSTGRIVSSPALGDIDNDGSVDIVIGINEYDLENKMIGHAYAIHGNGSENLEGAVLSGWPIEVKGLMSGVINFIGEGVPASPALADLNDDGKLEILWAGVGACPFIVNADGTLFQNLGCEKDAMGKNSNSNDIKFWTLISNGAFGDLDNDGNPEVAMSGSGMSFFLALMLSRYMKWDHLATVWNPMTGEMLDNFPRVIEDSSLLTGVSIADLSGDNLAEMIVGTSGYILHAYDKNGKEPLNWPKFTGGWLISAPTIGDIDGDGLFEVVATTREGYLFVWKTNGKDNIEWNGYRHDIQNTGNYEYHE